MASDMILTEPTAKPTMNLRKTRNMFAATESRAVPCLSELHASAEVSGDLNKIIGKVIIPKMIKVTGEAGLEPERTMVPRYACHLCVSYG